MLSRRNTLLDIKAEMQLTPEIENNLVEKLELALAQARRDVGETVEIPRQAALWLLEILESRRRGRGRPRADDIGGDIIVKFAKARKAEYIAGGKCAQEAHDEAAEEAERLARQHGIKLSCATIAKRMQYAHNNS